MAPWGAARPPGCLSSAQSWCPVRLCGFLGVASPLEEAEVLFQEARGGRRGGVGGGGSEKQGDHGETPGRSAHVHVLGPRSSGAARRGQTGLAGPCRLARGEAEKPFSYSRPRPSPRRPEPSRQALCLSRCEPTNVLHAQRGPPETRAPAPRHRNYEFACRISYVFMKSKCV